MSNREANAIADTEGLDLVLISPTAVPPVVKVMDYGKYKFEQTKKLKEAKKNQKIVEVKEVWLSATIDVNDLKIKAKQACKFLSEENKVRASIRLKGRQQAHPEIALDIMNDFYELVKDFGNMVNKPNKEGRTVILDLNPIVKK